MSHGRRSDGDTIPPIEIGSFVALDPEKSEFIGSASGVFFVNTVFRAFRELSAVPAEAIGTQRDLPSDHPSAHSLLTTVDNAAEQSTEGNQSPDVAVESSDLSYGVEIAGLGAPPRPETAKELLMTYFRKWHPFFPFLPGKLFMDQVYDFYGEHDAGRTQIISETSSHALLCRAVTFQCVFNLGGWPRIGQQHMPFESKIRSVSALMDLVGALSRVNNTPALQALLSVELYLITQMSLRAASTVHGTLTRMLYNCGFHRCPQRYMQLSPGQRDLRKRIFWSAYVLDRLISQSLGHPVALRDLEVDVCMPGRGELHNPVVIHHTAPLSQQNQADEVRAHLPEMSNRGASSQLSSREQQADGIPQNMRVPPTVAPEPHHTSGDGSEYTLSYMAQYSRLVGSALDLFHMSINNRSITMLKVQKLAYRIHSWWNNLPSVLQDEPSDPVTLSGPRYDVFFTIMYHYLILFINRPFLSLPPDRLEFKSCLQTALGAALAILHKLKDRESQSILFVFPPILSATWMSGLVVALAGIHEIYPTAKATIALKDSISMLSQLQHWASSRHCSRALDMLLVRLQSQSGQKLGERTAQRTATSGGTVAGDYQRGESYIAQRDTPGNTRTDKRRRLNEEVDGLDFASRSGMNQPLDRHINIPDGTAVQPVLEYIGPDFGFDANVMSVEGWQQGAPDQDLSFGFAGLFDHADWDAYMSNLDNTLSL